MLYFRLLVFKTKSSPGWLARSSRAFCFWQFVSSRLYNGSVVRLDLVCWYSIQCFCLSQVSRRTWIPTYPVKQLSDFACSEQVLVFWYLVDRWLTWVFARCTCGSTEALWVTEIYGHCRLPLRIKFEPCAIAGSWSKEVI